MFCLRSEPVNRILPLALLPLLAACAEGTATDLPFGLGGPDPAIEEGPPPLPPEVAPYMPPGVPGTLIRTGVNGCYVFSVEETDPPTGFPVRDNQGNQVCPASQDGVTGG